MLSKSNVSIRVQNIPNVNLCINKVTATNCVTYLLTYGNNFVSLSSKHTLTSRSLKYLWCMRGVAARLFAPKIPRFTKEKANYKHTWKIHPRCDSRQKETKIATKCLQKGEKKCRISVKDVVLFSAKLNTALYVISLNY